MATKPVVIGLKTLDMQMTTGPRLVDTAIRADKKRVFTEDEWKKLNKMSTAILKQKILTGDFLINILSRPEMMNMTPQQANMISSNLKFQQDAIREIIDSRSDEHGRR